MAAPTSAEQEERAKSAAWVQHLEAEEASLVFPRFSPAIAYELGAQIRSDYLAQYPSRAPAGAAATGIVISVQALTHSGGASGASGEAHALFAATAGDARAVSADNWDWVARKAATVRRYGRASFLVGRRRVAQGKPLEADPKAFAAHGGAVPVYVKGNEVGPVAVAVVSGLSQADDHKLVAEAMKKIIARLNAEDQQAAPQAESSAAAATAAVAGAGAGAGAAAAAAASAVRPVRLAPYPLPLVKKQLIVFDFDWSLADQDTDRWVHECLAPHLRRKMKALKPHVQFTDLCAQLLRELHAEGATPQMITDAMRSMPFHPGMIRGVKALKASTAVDTTFFLLSNSNTVYIDTILRARGLQAPEGPQIFTEIVTNPARFTSSGLLELQRRVPPPGAPGARDHGCKVGCSPNMCKGEELAAFLARHGGRGAFERVIYVGDGGNDYCPLLRLAPHDVALVRTHRGLQQRIEREGAPQAAVRYWAGAWEMEGILGELHGQDRTQVPQQAA